MIENGKHGIKTILVPTDFKEPSDVALDMAIDLARQQNARIYLLHVVPFRQTEDKNEMMQSEIDKFPEAKSVEIIPLIREGKPHEEILKVQVENNIDLIVIARNWGKGSLYIRFRSLTEKIRRKAQCSVLVIGD